MDTIIRSTAQCDVADIVRIYNHYIANTFITFETEAVPEPEMVQRIATIQSTQLPWLVAETPHGLAGYAYAAKWKDRFAYRFAVESTVYLDTAHIGKGVGLRLYSALLNALRGLSVHTVIGGIALPNEQSVGLHERLGFRKVAHFEQVGYKQNRWVDVGYWQMML